MGLSLNTEGPAVGAASWTGWQRRGLALQGDVSLFLECWRKGLGYSEAVTLDSSLGLGKGAFTCHAPGVLVAMPVGQRSVGH